MITSTLFTGGARSRGFSHIHIWLLSSIRLLKFFALFLSLMVSLPALAQKNIAPLGTASASTCNTGPCSVLNDLNFGTCGTQLMWISTSGPPSTTPGVEWLAIEWTSVKRFNKIVIHHAEQANRFLAGGLIQYWNGTTWVNHHTFSNLPTPACSSTVTFNPIAATKFRITSFQAGPGQNSNMNFRELEVIEAPGGINNAGVANLTAPINFCPGAYDVKVNIENGGLNKLDSVRVNWSIDGVKQATIYNKSSIDTAGSTTGNVKNVTLGNVSFAAGVVKTIKVWTSHPNGATDTMPDNDTLVFNLRPALSGNFTVGGTSPDFATPAAAANAISTYGVCGPVYFSVRPGTYSGRVVLKVSGASATNTITFDGGSKATTTINNSGTSTADWATVLVDGTDYVTFRNFTLNANGTSFGIGLMVTGGSDYCVFRNLDVNSSTTSTSTNFEGIVGSASSTAYSTTGNPGEYNLFEDINVSGGYYGVYYTGLSTSSVIEGSTFNRINVNGHYYYGINVQYLNNPVITNCRVATGRTTSSYGMRVYYCAGPVVMGNEAHGGAYGNYFYGNNYTVYKNVRGKMINNIFYGGGSYGVYGYYSRYMDYYHNTIVTATGVYAFSGQNGAENDFRNNIVVNYSNDNTDEVMGLITSTFINNSLDYNIYYAPNGAGIADVGTVYASLSAWQTGQSNVNNNSLEQDPGFVSSSDFRLDNTGAKPAGENVGITTDVDGDPRCEFAPTIGADENALGKGTIKVQAGIFGPATVYVNSPAVFEGKQVQGALQKNLWYLDGVFMKDTLDYVHTFTSTGNHTIRVVTIGCSSSDTADYSFSVSTQTAAPVADFAMETKIAQGDVLRFLDLSTNGPTQWKWEVTPDIYYDDNNQQQPRYVYMSGADTTHNPAVRFDRTGRYKVCLTVTNNFGNDQLCRTDYITVLPRVSMGTVNSVVDAEGYLYDDGGKFGNYSDGQLRGMLIRPCAEEVYLVFNEFKLECQDDYVRIYDGANNQAPVLHTCTTNYGNGGGPGLTGPGCALACAPTLNDTFTAKSGMMYIEFYSSGSGNARGFEARWWNKPAKVSPPVADFEAPDSVCVGSLYTFYNKSTGANVQVRWDLDNDMNVFESRDTVTAEWAFVIPGTASIKLIAENCGGTDTIVKTFTVFTPSAPAISFTTDNLNPTTTDDVTFSSTIKGCVDKYKWTFTKVYGSGLFSQLEGTTLEKAVTKVMFYDTGLWTVELWAENVTGNNTLVKTGYIKVKEQYCTPTVGTIISDVGISKVKFNTISNTSAQGSTAFSNYVSTQKTNIEIGATYDLEVSRTSNVNNISWAAWIDWNQDGDFDDFQEKVGSSTNSNTKVWTQPVTVPVLAKEGPTIMRVGVSRGAGSNTPCGQNSYGEFEDYRVIVTIDRTPPVITLSGNEIMIIEQGRKYTEPGYAAEDNLDGTITQDVKADTVIVTTNQITTNLNTYVVRDYEIRYRVLDGAGNIGTAVRTVRVIPDTTAPMLTVANGVSLSVDVAAGSYMTPAVIKAEDNIDGDFTTQVMMVTTIDPQMPDVVQVIDPVDPSKVGVYTVTYYAVDMLGNAIAITRKVEIYDDVMPTLTLLGNNPVKHQIGQPYSDAGVTAMDNFYDEAELSALMSSSTNINVNKFGTYNYTYTVSDPAGNGPVSVTRQIIVTDTIVPEIALIGPANMVVEVNVPFIDQGVKVSDNYGIKGSWTSGGSFYDNFPDAVPTMLGMFVITYSVEDLAGNIVTVNRNIEVKDRTAPVIRLKGNATVNICRWKTYNDSSYTVSDNFNTVGDLVIKQEGTWLTDGVKTGLNGTYSLRYIATDKSGNAAYSEERTINVLHETDFRCKGTYTGIEYHKALEKQVTVYPNPTTGKLNIRLNLDEMKQVHMSVVNMMGQEIAAVAEGQLIEGVWTVDLSAQASGVYFLRITTNDQNISKQIVLTK